MKIKKGTLYMRMNINDYNRQKAEKKAKLERVHNEEKTRKHFWIVVALLVVIFFIIYPQWLELILIDSVEGMGTGLIFLALMFFLKENKRNVSRNHKLNEQYK